MGSFAYDSSFYGTYAQVSINSAREVLAVVQSAVNPRSVVDVGCGVGTWLSVWRDLGIDDIEGIDGAYVKRKDLLISPDRFRAMDLEVPTKLTRHFDLVQSLEVAEHLPQRSADSFISFLCSLGPVVLFSAAIPYQGGTSHINEQWPEYWAALFLRQGYLPVDIIRDHVWDNPNVAYYYAQNTFLFVHSDRFETLGNNLRESPLVPMCNALSRVHPRKWCERNRECLPLESLIKMLPLSSWHFALRALHGTHKALSRSWAHTKGS